MYWILAFYLFTFFGFTIFSEFSEARQPFPSTQLTASVTETSTTIPVTSTSTFPSSGRLYFQSGEIVCYTSKTSTSFTVLSPGGRGCNDVGSTKRTVSRRYSSGEPIFTSANAVVAYGTGYNLVRETRELSNLSLASGVAFGLEFIFRGVPKFISFNYSYLEGELWGLQMSLVRLALIAVFGLPLVGYLIYVKFGR